MIKIGIVFINRGRISRSWLPNSAFIASSDLEIDNSWGDRCILKKSAIGRPIKLKYFGNCRIFHNK